MSHKDKENTHLSSSQITINQLNLSSNNNNKHTLNTKQTNKVHKQTNKQTNNTNKQHKQTTQTNKTNKQNTCAHAHQYQWFLHHAPHWWLQEAAEAEKLWLPCCVWSRRTVCWEPETEAPES